MPISKEDIPDGAPPHESLIPVGDFYRCDNAGRILRGSPGSWTVLCPCGRSSPQAQAAGLDETPATGAEAQHIKRYLPPASADEWAAQAQADHHARVEAALEKFRKEPSDG
jgi:hypothetical protein